MTCIVKTLDKSRNMIIDYTGHRNMIVDYHKNNTGHFLSNFFSINYFSLKLPFNNVIFNGVRKQG